MTPGVEKTLWAACVLLASCGESARENGGGGDGGGTGGTDEFFIVVTFNTGTTDGLDHDDPPDDGYTSTEAAISDEWYGNGLAWADAVEATRMFLEEIDPDVVAFQEIFFSEDCVDVPAEARAGFVCETWAPGDPPVVQTVLGEGYQVACHVGKPDKCAAVKRDFGTFRGCDGDFCLEGLVGSSVEGCGSGARVARGVIDRVNGETLTLVSVHGTSGFSAGDQDCRVRQIEQVFVELNDGEPAASGSANLVLGDFNTDPGRASDIDPSAARWNDFVGDSKSFHFITPIGASAPGAYLGVFDIDHVVSDVFTGSCTHAGLAGGPSPVFDGTYFDHTPAICTISDDP